MLGSVEIPYGVPRELGETIQKIIDKKSSQCGIAIFGRQGNGKRFSSVAVAKSFNLHLFEVFNFIHENVTYLSNLY